ncbi:histone-like nucleoid-structuring protein Lsr2 [Streptomyces sp. DH12]|uniref:Lsr2 family DNA-binding protein n=1 Tax=Streptomyces sp. DH12 TaxID=2857010 RepID=UPI001E42C01B|nr:histone-like nucleoid-structuring protein Lsr2 [Streptomyces sp. DH12]
MTSLNELTLLCPPPAEAPAVDWDAVENNLDMRLPRDYMDFAAIYGPGAFCEYIRIYHPLGATRWVDITGPMPTTIRNQLQQALDQGAAIPHNPQRLFAIGVTDNGEHLFWITDPQEAPDTWRIVVNEARGSRWYTFDGTLTEFLIAVLTGRTDVPMFPRDLLHQGVSFSPSPQRIGMAETAPRQPAAIDTAAVRRWARDHGHNLPERGRIPGPIIEAWKQAHGR